MLFRHPGFRTPVIALLLFFCCTPGPMEVGALPGLAVMAQTLGTRSTPFTASFSHVSAPVFPATRSHQTSLTRTRASTPRPLIRTRLIPLAMPVQPTSTKPWLPASPIPVPTSPSRLRRPPRFPSGFSASRSSPPLELSPFESRGDRVTEFHGHSPRFPVSYRRS